MTKSIGRSPDRNVTPATRVLDEADVAFVLHRFRHDPRSTDYGMEAVRELGVDAAQVFKTLVLSTGVGTDIGSLRVAVLPVQFQLDLRLTASAFGLPRIQLADPALAAKLTGYVVGGISPLGQRRLLPTVIDTSAQVHHTVFISAGRRGMDLEVAPSDLLVVLSATWAPVIRVPEPGLPRAY